MSTRKNLKHRKRERQEKALAKLEAIEKPSHSERLTIRDLRIKLGKIGTESNYYKDVSIENYLDWSLED